MTLRIWRSTFRKTGRFLYSCVVNVARYLELLRQEYPQEIAGKARVVKPAHACVCTDRKAFSDDLRTPGDERARLLRVVGKFTTKRWSIQAILFALASVAAHAVPQSPFSNNVLSKDWLERSAHSSARRPFPAFARLEQPPLVQLCRNRRQSNSDRIQTCSARRSRAAFREGCELHRPLVFNSSAPQRGHSRQGDPEDGRDHALDAGHVSTGYRLLALLTDRAPPPCSRDEKVVVTRT